MQIRHVFPIFISLIMLTGGCGRKGDPVRPVVPKPEPVRNVSATVTDDAIVLSWNAPETYDTGQPLDLMRDIRAITISRTQASSTDQRWNFAQSRDGWTAIGGTLPVKWTPGIARAASPGARAGLASPDNLGLPASQYRYVSVKLWAKHADRAYLVFLTSDDTRWDLEPETPFQPAVHTSVLSYQRAFAARKLKALPLVPHAEPTDRAREYLVDLREVPAWTGTIRQIGVVVARAGAGTEALELGLDSLSLLETDTRAAAPYDAPPWGFWQDEEGWRTPAPETMAAAAAGALSVRNDAGPLLLMSAPDQRISWNHVRYVQIRMRATGREQAYVLLRGTRDPAFEKRADRDLATPASLVLPLTIQPGDDFQVYTLTCPDFSERVDTLSQIGLYFPERRKDPVVIDYIAPARSQREVETFAPLLVQQNIPPLPELEEQVRRQLARRSPGFETAYHDLTPGREVFRDATVTLAQVSPSDPAPVVIGDDGRLTFADTGLASDDDDTVMPLRRGERYTYTIELTDRNGQVSVLPQRLSVTVPAAPSAPLSVAATASDREVRLTWQRPFLDTRGSKLRRFDGYRIYRATVPGAYAGAPVYQTAAHDTGFVDTAVVNGTTYYYVVQAVAAVTDTNVVGEMSPEVSATPADTVAPDAPVNLTSAYLAGTVRLFWNFSASPDWKGFNIYRGLAADGPFAQLNAGPVTQPAYDDATTLPNQDYFYYVTSFDTAEPANESQPSEIIPVRTLKR